MKKLAHILAFLALCVQHAAFGAIENYSEILDQSNWSTTLDVYDGRYVDMFSNPTTWQNEYTNQNVSNYIRLGIDPDAVIGNTFTAGTVSMDMEVEEWDDVSNQFVWTAITPLHLTITYDHVNGVLLIDDQETYIFGDGHHVRLTNITLGGGLTPDDVFLEAGIEVERYYAFDGGTVTGPGRFLVGANNEFLRVHWDIKPGAEFYELEFVHINDYTLDLNQYIPVTQLEHNFYMNSTRIAIKENYYEIPMVFDHGHILFRVRPVGKHGTDFKFNYYGDWSEAESGVVMDHSIFQRWYVTGDYDQNMNWYHAVDYTEDGRRNEGITYLDGLSRTRQTVARNTATDQVVISNIYYDSVSRPAVVALPTPVNGEDMSHRVDFNKAQTGPSFSAEHFNLIEQELCETPISMPFLNTSGTGEYYSDMNPDKDRENAYIPDSEGYPYTRIQYQNDFTGRVNRMAQAGAELSMGGGKEKRYIYVSPDNYELNAMFGTEVGEFDQYSKVVTIDENGQAYVTYLDGAGRVVASYMTGPSPLNVEALPESVGSQQTVPLIVGGQEADGDSPTPMTTFEQTVFWPYNNEDYTVTYGFTPQAYESSCLAAGICFDCMYDLVITITDECGAEAWRFTETVNGETFDAMCNTPGGLVYSELVENVPAGVYTIRKTLTVNQDAIDEYWCLYLENEICTPSINSIFNDYYNAHPFANCDEENVYEDGELGACEILRSVMLTDVSPGGQYALYSILNGQVTTNDPTSIFYGTPAYYSTVTYLDDNNDPILVDDGTGTLVGPDQLTPIQFVQLFDPSWAPSLLDNPNNSVYPNSVHPEYCYLEFCEANSNSDEYNDLMLGVYTFADANLPANAFLAPLGVDPGQSPFSPTQTGNPDPFFAQGGGGANFNTAMQNSMNTYITVGSSSYSIWQWAIVQALCTDAETEIEINSCLGKDVLACDLDLVWVTFRDLYLELKASYFFLAQQQNAANLGCENDCIGSPLPGCDDYADKVSRIGDIVTIFGVDLTQNPGGTVNLHGSLTGGYCNDICEDYADNWIMELAGCDFDTQLSDPQIAAMRADFIELCAYGCNGQHPAGATTTPTGQTTSGGYASVDDILEAYLGVNYESELCTELLISSPGAYQEELINESAFVSALDNCGCDILFQAEYDMVNNNPQGFTYIEEMVEFMTGLPVDDVNSMLCACERAVIDWQPGYTWTSQNITDITSQNILVPFPLTCEDGDCTIDCDDISTGLTYLDNRFSQVTDFTDTDQYPTIVENYFNNLYNYNLAFTDYNAFALGCAADVNNPYCQLSQNAYDFMDVLNLMIYRGQLTSTTQVDLFAENIVYNQTEFGDLFANDNFYSVTTGDNLDLYFDGGNCVVNLTGFSGINYEQIISVQSIMADGGDCTAASNFKLVVLYLDCGVLEPKEISGTTTCFDVSDCVCGNTGQVLCDDYDLMDLEPCYEPYLSEMYDNAFEDYFEAFDQLYDQFAEDYNDQCGEAFATEEFEYTGRVGNYQYTLNFYDRGGNLAKTVAPGGFDDAFFGGTSSAAINAARDAVTGSGSTGEIIPEYEFVTTYEYNSYNQIVKTTNADQEGDTRVWYDLYGRLRLTQNPLEADANSYSYTKYDQHGRVVEEGQVFQPIALDPADLDKDDLGADLEAWIDGGTRSEVTITTYDTPLSTAIAAKFKTGTQQNLRLRVATQAYFNILAGGTNLQTDYQTATHYSYDIHGNVIEMLQDVPDLAPAEQDIKSTQYKFELLSNNVEEVIYQEDELDYLKQSYLYDDMNRLIQASSTTDDVHTTKEARYHYYDYGPLARTEIGENEVQGFDYAYTINGWLKAMNSSILDVSVDIGNDGTLGYSTTNNDIHAQHGKDLASWTISYFEDDYKSINAGGNTLESDIAGPIVSSLTDMYNGNLRLAVTSIFNTPTLGAVYSHDQVNRLTQMDAFLNPSGFNTWAGISGGDDYYNAYTYDRNGNFVTVDRNIMGPSNNQVDRQTFNYGTVQGNLSNRLGYISEVALDDGDLVFDILAGQSDFSAVDGANYQYNKLGQLVRDEQEEIANIVWRLEDHQPLRIESTNCNKPQIEFVYNPQGQRVLKIIKPRSACIMSPPEDWTYIYHAYGSDNRIVATYEVSMGLLLNSAQWIEGNIYGLQREGQLNPDKQVYYSAGPPTEDFYFQNVRGERRYEARNHTGQVMATYNDRRIWNGTELLYEAVELSTTDYFPYGMPMDDLRYQVYHGSDSYRYGHDGMEKDNEIISEGLSYTTNERQYDPRLGRWKSLDPDKANHPSLSPYSSYAGNPVVSADPNDGQSPKIGNAPSGKSTSSKDGIVYVDEHCVDCKYTIVRDANGLWVRSTISSVINSDPRMNTTRMGIEINPNSYYVGNVNEGFELANCNQCEDYGVKGSEVIKMYEQLVASGLDGATQNMDLQRMSSQTLEANVVGAVSQFISLTRPMWGGTVETVNVGAWIANAQAAFLGMPQ